MTPERLGEIKSELASLRRAVAFWSNRPVNSLLHTVPEELVSALETERARLDWAIRSPSRFRELVRDCYDESITDIRGAIDSAIDSAREREKGAGG